MNKYKVTTMTKFGTCSLALGLLYNALHEDDMEFFNEDIGQNILAYIEMRTGLTLEFLSSLVKNKTTGYESLKSGITLDAKYMTISELASKYNVSNGSMRNFCNRNNIKYRSAVNQYL